MSAQICIFESLNEKKQKELGRFPVVYIDINRNNISLSKNLINLSKKELIAWCLCQALL